MLMSASLARNFSWRPFGCEASDLEIDFEREPRPQVAMQILAACASNIQGEQSDAGYFWNMTISERIRCLLGLAFQGKEEIPLSFRCLQGDCQELLEITITWDELAGLHPSTGGADILTITIGNESLRLRRPTGSDQLKWLASSFADEEAALRAMARDLIVDRGEIAESLPGQWLKEINRAMSALDPLVAFHLRTRCPFCGEENEYEIDLEQFALVHLREVQRQLIETVHCLAACYHWNEREILLVSPWRRARYLALIEKERSR